MGWLSPTRAGAGVMCKYFTHSLLSSVSWVLDPCKVYTHMQKKQYSNSGYRNSNIVILRETTSYSLAQEPLKSHHAAGSPAQNWNMLLSCSPLIKSQGGVSSL